MPNQRKAGKKLIGCFADESLKQAIKNTGLDQTTFVEIAVVRELLDQGEISIERLERMLGEGKLKEATARNLLPLVAVERAIKKIKTNEAYRKKTQMPRRSVN